MKKIIVALGVLIASSAFAQVSQDIVTYELARVVRVQPITTTRAYTVPRQSCTMEQIPPSTTLSNGETIISPQQSFSERCVHYTDREYKSHIVAYDVMFEYRGQVRTTRFMNDPGNTIRIKVITRINAIE